MVLKIINWIGYFKLIILEFLTQRSILGSLLWMIVVNYLPNFVAFKMVMIADDTSLMGKATHDDDDLKVQL